MKRRKKSKAKRLIIFPILLSGMMMLGVSYAAWNSELHIEACMGTGCMNILFHGEAKEKYCVELVDENDMKLSLDAEVKVKDEGKKAELRFKKGLPMDLLCQGDQIRVKFDMKADENSIGLIQEREIKSDEPDEKLEMKAERGMLIKDSKLFTLRTDSEFMIPLEFEVYRAVETKEHRMTGIVYLKLTPESIQKVKELPRAVLVSEAELEPIANCSLEEEKMAEEIGSGVAVVYSVELPFLVEQKEVKAHISEKGGNL